MPWAEQMTSTPKAGGIKSSLRFAFLPLSAKGLKINLIRCNAGFLDFGINKKV